MDKLKFAFLNMFRFMHHWKMIAVILAVCALLILIGYTKGAYTHSAPPKAVAGILDLRHWDFEHDGSIALSGEWEFYWKRLYKEPQINADKRGYTRAHENQANPRSSVKIRGRFTWEDKAGLGTTIQPGGIFAVPGSWNAYIGSDNAPLGAYGYATFRLRVLLPEGLSEDPQSLMRISLKDAGSAYSIQVFDAAGQPLSSRMEGGQVGTSREISRPARRSETIPVQAAQEWIVVWQISNFSNSLHGGPFFSPQIGDDAQLSHALTVGRLAIALNTGILLVMGIYHLMLFALRPRDKALLWFSLLCFEAAFRTCGAENCFGLMFPDADVWLAGHLAELISFGLGIPTFVLFIKAMFPKQSGGRLPKVFVALGGMYILSLLLTPVRLHFPATIAFEIVTLFAAIWVISVLVRAIRARQRLAGIISVGTLVLVVCVINDMLYAELLIESVDLTHYGQSFFILCQAIVMAFANQKAHNTWKLAEQEKHAAQAEALCISQEKERFVREQNLILERKVQERTEELLRTKEAALEAKHAADEARIVAEEARIEAETAQKASEEANQAKSTFLASMSHELRTPLTVILGYAEILQIEDDLEDRHYKAAATIHRCGEHLLLMINDLLDLSKIEAGKIELTPRKFPLPNFLKNLVTNAQFRAAYKKITLKADLSSQLPNTVYADERRLRQVLENLLNNAIKFTDNGTVSLRVTEFDEFDELHELHKFDELHKLATHQLTNSKTQKLPNSKTLRFEIEDSGIGIPQADIQKIFAPFYQVREARIKGEGSGLGLAISRQLVHLMGSELQVKSTPGQGTTFWFDLTLPVTMEDQAAKEFQMLSHIIGYKGTERKILIVDDNRENRTLLKDILSPLGFALMEAGNGQEALHATTQFIPDLILMDIFMPGMSGVEATHHLQQISGSHTIIGLSASPQTQQGSLAAGCSDFLVKPIQIDQLLTCVGQHLQLEWEYIEPEKPRSATLAMTDAALSS